MIVTPIVYFLIGLPYSGKSTFTKAILANDNRPEDWVIVSSDKWLENKAILENINYNEAFLKYAGEAQRLMFEEAHAAIRAEKNVIWDQTNLTPKARSNKVALFGDNYYKVAVVFDVIKPEVLAERRAKRTDKVISDEILSRMSEQFTRPTIDEGFDSIVDPDELEDVA